MKNLDLTADYIDVRDIIARVEELREGRSPLQEAFDEADLARTALSEVEDQEAGYAAADVLAVDAAAELAQWNASENGEELTALEAILSDLRGNGGDEEWEGDWYPVTLIRDSHFETAMDELLEDIGDMPKNIPAYLRIVVDYDALQMDYTSTEIDGVTYWYR